MSASHDIRIYGPTVGHGSWARVAAGMAHGLHALGRLAGFFPLESAVREVDGGLGDGYDADVGVLVGPPSFANVLRGRGDHRRRVVMIAANSSWLPGNDIRVVESAATEAVAPSRWSADVVRSHTSLPVGIWPHGVYLSFRVRADAYAHREYREDGRFRVLHLASTRKERKGTVELLQAWRQLHASGLLGEVGAGASRLDIVLPGPHADLGSGSLSSAGVFFHPRLNLDEAAMAALYQCHDLVCQPSRSEGFGLVPLEARACGVPVCATFCTGHADHLVVGSPGFEPIVSGPPAPIDDGPGALAPSVSVDDVSSALLRCRARAAELRREAFDHATELGHRWSWERGCLAWLGSSS